MIKFLTKYVYVAITKMWARLFLAALKKHTSLSTEFSGFIPQLLAILAPKDVQIPHAQLQRCIRQVCSFTTNSGVEWIIVLRSWISQEWWVSVSWNSNLKLGLFCCTNTLSESNRLPSRPLFKKCDGKNVVMQVNFSENATTTSQCEIQSAHWNHGQATLFTAHA